MYLDILSIESCFHLFCNRSDWSSLVISFFDKLMCSKNYSMYYISQILDMKVLKRHLVNRRQIQNHQRDQQGFQILSSIEALLLMNVSWWFVIFIWNIMMTLHCPHMIMGNIEESVDSVKAFCLFPKYHSLWCRKLFRVQLKGSAGLVSDKS